MSEKKLDKIFDRLGSIDTTLVEQHAVLKEHIRRTNLLEEEIKPIKAHVARVEGVVKFILALAAILATIAEFKR
jgi:hypothetical protein